MVFVPTVCWSIGRLKNTSLASIAVIGGTNDFQPGGSNSKDSPLNDVSLGKISKSDLSKLTKLSVIYLFQTKDKALAAIVKDLQQRNILL